MVKGSKSKKVRSKKKTVETSKEVKKKEITKALKKKEPVAKKKVKKTPVTKKTSVKNEETVKEIKVEETLEKKEIVEKVEPKKAKVIKKSVEKPKKEIKVKHISKKGKRKITLLLIMSVILSVFLVFLIIINKNSYNKNVSFVTKNGIKVSSPWTKFRTPIYSFAVDKKEKPVEVENLTFLDKKITYNFTDIKREILDDGDVLITIPCEMEAELEYVVGDDIDTNWIYTYSFAPVFAFDYYSGDIYHEKTISDSSLVVLDSSDKKEEKKDKKKSKTKEKEEDQMVYTEQEHDDKKITIGILNNSTKSTWGNNLYQGNDDDGKHFIVDNKSTTIIYIKAPKTYDGLALAINKNGATYDTWKKEYDYYEKIISLQEEEKETGEKNSELEKLEKEKENIHKLIDKNDELRKEYTKDDFYVIRISDMFKDDYLVKEESDFNLLYVTGMLVLSLSVLTCIFMAISERNKAYGKGFYSR